mmetsp:Transcript_2852/g.4193  ORF Transcript_2852/g.4193 Transcript_2852/m.4193 type:complete len:143 (-) Transcript_2852:334-762(-)
MDAPSSLRGFKPITVVTCLCANSLNSILYDSIKWNFVLRQKSAHPSTLPVIPMDCRVFLLVHTFKPSLVHCIVEMTFVVVRLNLLQTDNVWSDINYFSNDILEPKVPREGPEIGIWILLLRRVDFSQNIISHDAKPRAPPRR